MVDVAESASLLARARRALAAARDYADAAGLALAARVSENKEVSNGLLDREQRAAHGYAWTETTVTALAALLDWAEKAERRGDLHDADILALEIAFGEQLAQLIGGLPMGPAEIFRPRDLGIENAAREFARDGAAAGFLAIGNSAANRVRLVTILGEGGAIDESFDDATLNAVRGQFRRFAAERILPNAQAWHLANALVPDAVVAEMATLGAFGVCIPEAYGGQGLGRLAMCVISEELSRGWIGAGSLGTRSEIAGELILLAGTDAQKAHWLPKIAKGEILPAAAFTEPDAGSDLGAIKTRASRTAAGWSITGAKTWITHAARSDLMTLLVRTPAGLSMFLAAKPRGTTDDPFPAAGMSGTEIEVLGYRGMREYELAFDGFEAPEDSLLGGKEGEGFKQLMRTFESARIQTAARGVGVARRAFELGLAYALVRKQFGRPIIEFPRVSDKLAMMAVDTLMARELAYFSAREKDKGRRCDIEAGMAKLFAARAAWANADASLQIHGGAGYALESEISRVFCDARILSIFEGSAEIQAHIIARGRLAERLETPASVT